MTIKLLTPYGQYPYNAVVSLDAATETGLIASGIATANTTGGVVYVPPSTAAGLVDAYFNASKTALVDPDTGATVPIGGGLTETFPGSGIYLLQVAPRTGTRATIQAITNAGHGELAAVVDGSNNVLYYMQASNPTGSLSTWKPLRRSQSMGQCAVKVTTTAAIASGGIAQFGTVIYDPNGWFDSTNTGIKVPNGAQRAVIRATLAFPYNATYGGTYRKAVMTTFSNGAGGVGYTGLIPLVSTSADFAPIVSGYAQQTSVRIVTAPLDVTGVNDDGAGTGFGDTLQVTVTHDAAATPNLGNASFLSVEFFDL